MRFTIYLRIILTWIGYLLIFMLAKPLFMLANCGVYADAAFSDIIAVIAHGLRMDAAVAAYLTVVPSLMTIAFIFIGPGKWHKRIFKIWFGLISAILALIYVTDAVLYGYWGFRLDTTPIFYFTTSPASAMASASAAELVVGTVAIVIVAMAFYLPFAWLYTRRQANSRNPKWRGAVLAGLLTALLFVPIRGGVTVSTVNLSSAYFSPRQELNHAAINPVFSFIASATHPDNLDSTRFMDAAVAESMFADMVVGAGYAPDSVMLTDRKPDIYLVILESFSNHLFPSLGGENIAVGLDSIASSGIVMTNFFATTFRTDRALPAILGGMPSPPDFSVLKDVGVASRIGSLPRKLKDAGYELSYYYGGDVNFTNMLAYLVNSGFDRVVRDSDFPVSQRLSKWGVHDGPLMDYAYGRLRDEAATAPRFCVVQTSSSHEPFTVPAEFARCTGMHKAANSFAYADSCVTAFVNRLNSMPSSRRKLIILVPDHYNAYPRGLKDPVARHRVPLILTGDALASAPRRIEAYSSQLDIAPTLLSMLSIPYAPDEFKFGNNLLNPDVKPRAVFFDKGVFALIDSTATEIVNVNNSDGNDGSLRAKAYLQSLCHYLSKLKNQR